MHASRSLVTPLISAAFTCALLAGCSESVDLTTAGKSEDATVASAERSGDDDRSQIRRRIDDAAITASIKAQLAGDAELSALRVSVETSNGLVSLRGRAPSAEARERAAQIASAVPRVGNVDNRLVVSQR